ncbi:hypothetical protein [Brachybacterium sp. YJGR34]|uniref:hypothetical protein n=1 Tax=Brachybacterium sp. YJGR34 TaxID=2059911 RepID=UPI000E0BDE72|nr:hypothetical protein [Brachybacterium sp. YJGR34]
MTVPSSSAPQNPLSPQGGAPSPYGTPAPAPKKPSKAPTILMIIGGVILALSVIVGIVLAVIGIGGVVGSTGDLEEFSGGSGTISAEAGEELQVYADENAMAPVECTISGPSESSVGPGPSQSSTIGTGDTTWVSVDSFTAKDAGEYTVDCGGTPIAVGPPVSIGGIFAGVGGILIGVFGGIIGAVLLALGIILKIVGRKKA